MGFTNTGEDVDDLIKEQVDEETKTYQKWINGKSQTTPIETKVFNIKVRGETSPRFVEGWFVDGRPLRKIKRLENQYYSRKWTTLDPSRLRLPILSLMKSKTIHDANKAIDKLTTPSQNILLIDHKGTIAYRASGTGVVRKHLKVSLSLYTQKTTSGFIGKTPTKECVYKAKHIF